MTTPADWASALRYGTTPIVARSLALPGARDLAYRPARFGQANDPNTIDANDPAVQLAAALSLAGSVLGAYHGYKRNNSVGWAVAWFFLGGFFPFITIPVSLAQGFGKPAGR